MTGFCWRKFSKFVRWDSLVFLKVLLWPVDAIGYLNKSNVIGATNGEDVLDPLGTVFTMVGIFTC